MNLLALLLFGSRARGDQSNSSDIDLLAVTENDKPTVSGDPKASLYQYSPDWLEAKASSGDLFIWHLVSEARPIYDPTDQLGILRKQFHLRANYDEQISNASDVAWMIVSSGKELPSKTANRWLAWSVRTISIARAAGRQTPAFSANALSETLGYPEISTLVTQKDEASFHEAIGHVLKQFLHRFGAMQPSSSPQTLTDFESYFVLTKNEIGSSILRQESEGTLYV